MIVEEGYVGLHPEKFKYRCTDLLREYQLWSAYEFDVLDRPNNWKIATDNDIVNHIARFVDIKIGAVGTYDVKYLEYGMMLIEYVGDILGDAIILDAEELIQLKQIIEQRVGV
jgi:hypothetical protein